MEFHPDKCEVISVTRKKHTTLHPHYIHGHQLKNVYHVKNLGINITSDLCWEKHVDIICNKVIVLLALSGAMLTLAMLRSRLWHINVMYAQSWSTVLRCGTHTLLVPPGSWSRYKARYTLGRYWSTCSVDAMLTQLEWEPLAAVLQGLLILLCCIKSIMAL